jgi:hypothetical protein
MWLASMMRDNSLAETLENGVEGRGLVGRVHLEQLASGWAVERPIGRLVSQRGKVRGDKVSDLPSELAHGRVVEVQRSWRSTPDVLRHSATL